MKKLITLLLILVMAFSLTACWGESDDGTGGEGSGEMGTVDGDKGYYDKDGWTRPIK